MNQYVVYLDVETNDWTPYKVGARTILIKELWGHCRWLCNGITGVITRLIGDISPQLQLVGAHLVQ